MNTLIIKPTSACNFNCKFCSMGSLKIKTLTSFDFDLTNVSTVIITGGEPFMTPQSFFLDLIRKIEHIFSTERRLVVVSVTSNLSLFSDESFCKKWKDILIKPFISVIGSFQYGTNRTCQSTPFSQQDFIKCCRNFEKYFYYTPDFISLIDKSNEEDWYKHIRLARMLGTKCKLNNTLHIGNSKEYYPRWKMFEYYLTILKKRDEDFEKTVSTRSIGVCDFNTNEVKCWDSLKTYSGDRCTGFCEHLSEEDQQLYNQPLKEECLGCELCGLCNNCKVQKSQLMLYGNISEHCNKMLSMKQALIKEGFCV